MAKTTTTKKTTTAKKTTATKSAAVKKTTTAAKKLSSNDILAMLKAKYDEAFDDGGVYCIKKGGKWGFADAKGEIKIKPTYTGIGEEWIEDIITTWAASGIGFVNKQLREIVKPQFRNATPFRKGFAAVRQKNGKWGIIDNKGKSVVPFVFDNIEYTSSGKIEATIGTFKFTTK